MLSWAIAGVRPLDAVVFVVVQLVAAIVATGVASYLFTLDESPGYKPTDTTEISAVAQR